MTLSSKTTIENHAYIRDQNHPRLLEIQKEEQKNILTLKKTINRLTALSRERAEILAGAKRTKKPVKLKFDKNLIAWENGAISIKGKGYRFLEILYEAEGMQLEIADFEEPVWGIKESDTDKMVKQDTFTEFVRWLSRKLEEGKFPYILTQIKCEERTENTGEIRNGKPVKKRFRSETTGAKLHTR